MDRRLERARLNWTPLRELPYGPAAGDKPQQRPDTCQHPTTLLALLFQKIFLATLGASTHVHDDDIAGVQRRNQFLFDGSGELLSVDRSVEDTGRGQAIVAQGGDEGRRLPMTEWRVADQSLADLTRAVARRHGRGRPGFVDEDELPRVEGRLRLTPCGARGGDVRTLLLGRAKRFLWNGPPLLPAP